MYQYFVSAFGKDAWTLILVKVKPSNEKDAEMTHKPKLCTTFDVLTFDLKVDQVTLDFGTVTLLVR